MIRRREPDDILHIVAGYAPSADVLAAEWSSSRRLDTLAAIIGEARPTSGDPGGPPVYEHPLRFIPVGPAAQTHRGRWSRGLPVAASVAVLALAAAAIVGVVRVGGSGGSDPAGAGRAIGPAFTPPAGLSRVTIGVKQYAYRADRQIDLGADGRPNPTGDDNRHSQNWVSADGDIVSVRTGTPTGCFVRARSGDPEFTQPTVSFLAGLPTDVAKLNNYLRTHVQGSSSRDEAVFVAIGDMLRTSDGLASPALRGALVAVLSRTPGVTVHEGQRDYLGRPAVRADFVDQPIRPGETQSLYFHPSTFQLLEERDGSNGQPSSYNGPSPAYTAPAPEQTTPPGELTGAAYLNVMTAEKVVDELPKLPPDCAPD